MFRQILREDEELRGRISALATQVTVLNANAGHLSQNMNKHMTKSSGSVDVSAAAAAAITAARSASGTDNTAPQQAGTKPPQKRQKPRLVQMQKGRVNPHEPAATDNTTTKDNANDNSNANSYAQMATTKPGETPFTDVRSKSKKKTGPQKIKPLYDPNDQKVII